MNLIAVVTRLYGSAFLEWIVVLRFSRVLHIGGKQQLEFEVVLADASVEDLAKAKLAFDDPKGMLHLGPEVGFHRPHQFKKLVVQLLCSGRINQRRADCSH